MPWYVNRIVPDSWLERFGEAREIAAAMQNTGYFVQEPSGGFPTVETVRASCSDEQWSRVMDHALCLACLDGNAFPDLIEQYVPEAWSSLQQNGWIKDGNLSPLPQPNP